MSKNITCTALLILVTMRLYAQDAPNSENSSMLSPTTQAASKISSMPVNIFTGIPDISVPIYSYGNNGLSFGVSLNYIAGGIQVQEYATTVGLGWYLNAGGAIARTVRGMPDDIPQYGYLYAPAILADFRGNGDKYYFDSLDSQQDVFQFSMNGRSGKFFIGKNGQIALIPQSKMKIEYVTDPNPLKKNITSFKITTEDGVKFIFADCENSTISANLPNTPTFPSGYAGKAYTTAWNLTQIISAFNTDTIKLNYITTHVNTGFAYPQTSFFRSSDGLQTATYAPLGKDTSDVKKISSVVFPDKTNLSFVYSYKYIYGDTDYSLSRINISDTIFRKGYILDYQVSYMTGGGSGGWGGSVVVANPTRPFLKSVTPYTAKESDQGYMFTYNNLLFPAFNGTDDLIQYKKDHWGYYNGAYNGTNLIPTVAGINSGANRTPNSTYAISSSLSYMYLPGGGYVFYEYELNDHLPYTKSVQQLTLNNPYFALNNMALTDVLSTQRQINFGLSSSVYRTGSPPLSGNCIFNCSVIDATQIDSVYTSFSFSLYDLFYTGSRVWKFTLPDGNYRLQTNLSGGGTVGGSFPVVVNWENKVADNSINSVKVGGLRIKRISRRTAIDDPVNAEVTEYKYIREDGKSSGFLGDIPKYDYPYQEKVNSGITTTTDYTAISSEPLNNMNYTQGSPVGYQRVEVIKGAASHNLGKIVYEFTDLHDVASNFSTATFPYSPQDIKEWGLGLPKKVLVYDSAGHLIKKTVNTFSFSSTGFTASGFKNIKLGCSSTIYNGPYIPTTPKTRIYIAQEYYPSTGRVTLTSTTDTLYHSNGSTQVSTQNFEYDPLYYNVKKITASYDRNKGLQLETRLYYPYDYTLAASIGRLRDSGIISPVISSEKWIIGDANPRMLDASITSYQTLSGGRILPSGMYKLQSNQPVAQSVIGVFNPALLVRNNSYIKPQSTISVYDERNNVLQIDNAITNQSAAVIMDYNNQYPVAKIANAINTDVAYTSFESDGTGNWAIASNNRNSTDYLTGKLSYNLSNGNITKTGLTTSQIYLVTVWGKGSASVTINGSSAGTSIATQNGWNLYSKTITGINTITISGSAMIDELRLHPKDANMATTTYEPNIGVTTTTDANNTITYYEYDKLNRLKLIRDKDKNIIKRNDYFDYVYQSMIDTSQKWVFDTVMCNKDRSGRYDSVFVDTNFYSNTHYQKKYVFIGYNFCGCVAPGLRPTYKMVNNICEEAVQRCNIQKSRYKVIDNNNVVTWYYSCTYYYKWSDNSVSQNVTEYLLTTDPVLGCAGIQ